MSAGGTSQLKIGKL